MSAVLFSAIFASSCFKTLWPDILEDYNFISSSLLQKTEESCGDLKFEALSKPRTFFPTSNAHDGSEAIPICEKYDVLDLHIHVHHVKALKVLNRYWLKINQSVPEKLLRRPIRKFLVNTTSEILATATDILSCIVEANHLFQADEHKRYIYIYLYI